MLDRGPSFVSGKTSAHFGIKANAVLFSGKETNSNFVDTASSESMEERYCHLAVLKKQRIGLLKIKRAKRAHQK